MAGFTHSKASVFRFDTITGSSGQTLGLADITAYVTGVDGLPGSIELTPITSLAESGPKFSGDNMRDATFTLSLMYNSDVSSSGQGFPISLMNWYAGNSTAFTSTGTRSFEYSPDSTGSGKKKLTGEARITSITSPASLGNLVLMDAEFQVDGLVTIGAH